MAVGALEAKIDAVNGRVSDLQTEVRRANDDRRGEILRERDRVDDVFDAQLALTVSNAKLQTTIKLSSAIIALLTPMLVALGVWLVMRNFRETAAPQPAVAAATAPAQPAAPPRLSPTATATALLLP